MRIGDLPITPDGIELIRRTEGLTLVGHDGLELRGDFARLLPRLRPSALRGELLVRAARVKGVPSPRVVDATAGLGEDSFLLAATGFTVTLYERDAVIAALLSDALERAQRDEDLCEIARRMTLVEGDGEAALRAMKASPETSPDVVYLDPMFPERRRNSTSLRTDIRSVRILPPCKRVGHRTHSSLRGVYTLHND